MPKIKSAPFSFINHLQQVHFKKNEVESPELAVLLQRFKDINTLPFSHLPAFFVIDYTRQDYLMMSEGARQVSSYAPEEFMESGLEKLLDIYNKDDFRVYNENIFPANQTFLQSLPREERQHYIFNYTFRIKNGKGQIAQIFQRGNYITNEEGQPVYSVGMILNVTGVFPDRIMFHSIEKTGNDALAAHHVVQQNYFYPYKEDTLLTGKEKDIAAYMAEGLSIKQIAAKLNSAENTVANHRKNMLRKTNTKNMAELVAFLIRNRII